MAYNIFDTRMMLAALAETFPPRTFILNTFFSGEPKTFDTEYVDVDIYKGKRRLAPFVNPRKEGKLVEKIGYSTRSIKPAYVKPKMVTTAEDILKRGVGSHIYAPGDGPAKRAQAELGKNLAEMNDMITRREEWMATMALTTGHTLVIGEGVDDDVDFQFSTTHLPTLTGTALWTDHTNADPLGDLKTWKRLIAKDSGVVPTIAIMGTTAIDNFMQCDKVIGTTGGRSLFNMININIGKIDPKALPNGVTYYGYHQETGLDIYTYEEWYIDDESGIEQPMIPANKVLLGSPSARTDKLYGAIKDLSALASVPRFPKSWVVEDPSARFVMLQSSPLMVPTQVDAFLCATVTA